jgi:hypothetical protein
MRPIAERRAKTDFAVRTANSKRPKGRTLPIPSDKKSLQKRPEGLNPVTVAVHYRRTDAEDKRDRIYSFLGLLDDGHRRCI